MLKSCVVVNCGNDNTDIQFLMEISVISVLYKAHTSEKDCWLQIYIPNY